MWCQGVDPISFRNIIAFLQLKVLQDDLVQRPFFLVRCTFLIAALLN
jgi:hypothetical protein